jgi:hypothetical protein
MKQGSNEHPSIPDSADDSSSLPDHLFFPVWEDSLEEVACVLPLFTYHHNHLKFAFGILCVSKSE